MKALGYILTFALGAAAGVAASFGYAKRQYEEKTQNELDSLRETYRKMVDIHDKAREKKEAKKEKTETEEDAKVKVAYSSLANQYNKSGTFHKEDIPDPEDEEETGDDQGGYVIVPAETLEERKKTVPYIINEEDVGNYEGEPFDELELTMFSDGVIVDDAMDLIGSIGDSIGDDVYIRLRKGEFDDEDVIHVRNRRLKVDYSIVRDPRTYDEFLGKAPWMVEAPHVLGDDDE